MGTVIPLRAYHRRRLHRRVVLLRQPVALLDAFGTAATAETTDISMGGMQVRSDRYTVDSLHVSDRALRVGAAVQIDAHLKLPLSSGPGKMDVECRLVYVLCDDDDSLLMGLQFLRFSDSGLAVLERFVQEAEAFDLA